MGGGGGEAEGGWGITTTLQFLHLALLAPLEALTAWKAEVRYFHLKVYKNYFYSRGLFNTKF